MFSYEWRRETKLEFRHEIHDHRSGCCGCFIPRFPCREFLEHVETREMLFDLKLLYAQTHHVRINSLLLQNDDILTAYAWLIVVVWVSGFIKARCFFVFPHFFHKIESFFLFSPLLYYLNRPISMFY